MRIFSFLTLFLFAGLTGIAQSKYVNIPASDPNIVYIGRFDFSRQQEAAFAWSGSTIRAAFEGKVCNILLKDESNGNEPDGSERLNHFNIIIDNNKPFVLSAGRNKELYVIDTLKPGKHTISIHRRTEAFVGKTVFKGFQLESGKKLLKPSTAVKKKIEFIGNSITCGYGVEGSDQHCPFSSATENNYKAYCSITARALNADYHSISYSGIGLFRNFDSTFTNTMPHVYNRIFPWDSTRLWDFSRYTPDLVIINLGTNDFFRGNPDSTAWVNTYISFIKNIRKNYPKAQVLLLNGPMMSDYFPVGFNVFTTYKKYISGVIKYFKAQGVEILEYNLSRQGNLGYGCDWHPSAAQQEKAAEELTAFIRTLPFWKQE